jgi:hypothetical protein
MTAVTYPSTSLERADEARAGEGEVEHAMRQRWLTRVLGVLVGLALISCGARSTREGVTTQPGGEAPGSTTTAAPDGVRAFRAALAATPLLATIDIGPLDPARAESHSDAILAGTLEAVEVGQQHTVASTTVECEAAEGQPTGEQCPLNVTMQMLRFTIAVDAARTVAGDTPEPNALGPRVTIDIPLGPGGPAAGPSIAAGEAIQAAAPIGQRMAAYAFRNPVGDLQQTHPDGFALVRDDGELVSLAAVGSYPGLFGQRSIEELELVAP